MRVFKKIMYIILALVPILPLLLFAVCNIGNTNGVDVMPYGSFAVKQVSDIDYPTSSQSMILVEKDSILSLFLEGVIPSNEYIMRIETTIDSDTAELQELLGVPYGEYYAYVETGSDPPRFISRVAGVYEWFSSVGLTPPLYVVFIFAYLCYMLFIHVCFMIFDLIVFVPRKISEMLEV